MSQRAARLYKRAGQAHAVSAAARRLALSSMAPAMTACRHAPMLGSAGTA
ncbi:MAG: hypothetical protein SF053_11170 [Bacteroidia bacterium]|nr:hypothetical protein [Bacteroidia bacterium]